VNDNNRVNKGIVDTTIVDRLGKIGGQLAKVSSGRMTIDCEQQLQLIACEEIASRIEEQHHVVLSVYTEKSGIVVCGIDLTV
jgi:hypothetical protein